MTNNVVQLPHTDYFREDEAPPDYRPRIERQFGPKGSKVKIAHGGALALGTWIGFQNHIAIVEAHQSGIAIAALHFEKSGGGWGRVRTAVRRGEIVHALTDTHWRDLLASQVPGGYPVGAVRQDCISTPSLVPDPVECRGVVVGTSGSGKSSAMNAFLVNWRNALVDEGATDPPALVVFDVDGDYLGRVRDRSSDRRPNLVQCLKETPIVLSAGDLTCRATEIPAPLLIKCAGQLTNAQKRWRDIYVLSDEDHDPIRWLLFPEYEPHWAQHFPELARDGKISATTQDSLVTLRAKLKAALSPPLFAFDGASTWSSFMRHVEDGRTLIIDLSTYPDFQQALVIVLVVRSLKREAELRARDDRPFKKVLLVADEIHTLDRDARSVFELVFRRARKNQIGVLLGSQSLADFPLIVQDLCNFAIVLKSEGREHKKVIERWPQLSPVANQVDSLQAGDGFAVVGATAWPVRFDEPRLLRARPSSPRSETL